MGIAIARDRLDRERPGGIATTVSTSEFHAPQVRQRPSHRGKAVAQDWQTNALLAVARATGYAASTGVFSVSGSIVSPASGERSTTIVSDALKRPTRSASASGSSTMFWMTRRSGRAP